MLENKINDNTVLGNDKVGGEKNGHLKEEKKKIWEGEEKWREVTKEITK